MLNKWVLYSFYLYIAFNAKDYDLWVYIKIDFKIFEIKYFDKLDNII